MVKYYAGYIFTIQSMKKRYTFKQAILWITLLLMASCANNDLLNEYELSTAAINFTQFPVSETKSKSITPLADFAVFAYYTGQETIQDYLLSGKTPVANWMFNQKVMRNNQGIYTYNPIMYWPLNPQDKISFFSHSPADSKNIAIISPDAVSKAGAPVYKYTTNIENPTEDFLVSLPASDLTRQSGSVKFQMQHVLSKLQFNIKSTGNNIRIKSIGLKSAFTQANFTTLNREWSSHEVKSDLKTYEIAETDQLLGEEYKLFNENYLVIPQDISELNKPVFTLTFEDAGVLKTKEFSPTAEWTSQNLYTYNIVYSSDGLFVNTGIEAWITNSSDDLIQGSHYINISSRSLDLTQSNHLYYNSSYPEISVAESAKFTDNKEFSLFKYFDIAIEDFKINILPKDGTFFPDDEFTIYIEGKDQRGYALSKLPVIVKTEGDHTIEIDGTFWAPGNLINRKGILDFAEDANAAGLYFKWSSLVGLSGNNHGSFAYKRDSTYGFRTPQATGELPKWMNISHDDQLKVTLEDAFEGRYYGAGFDAKHELGDPCRYLSSQPGWTKGNWRLPTINEFKILASERKIRRRNGNWDPVPASDYNELANTGHFAVNAGWFVKVDDTDDSMPSDNEFVTDNPPRGWVYYPASGMRKNKSGAHEGGDLMNFSQKGYYWTSSGNGSATSYCMTFSDMDSGDNKGSFTTSFEDRFNAYPIRCVRDTKK